MYVLGLYSDGNYFKVSLISKKKGKIQIEFLKEFNKGTGNLDILKKNIGNDRAFFKQEIDVVTALPMHEVFIKKIIIPLANQGQVYKALELELSTDEDFLSGERFYVPKLVKMGDQTEVTLFAYTKESMERHLLSIESLGVDPDQVSSVSSAFTRFTAFCNLPSSPYFLFHLGWESSSIHFFYQGKIAEEASFSLGFKHIIDAVQKDQLLIATIDMDKVQELFFTALEEKKGSFVRELFTKLDKSITRIQKFICDKDTRANEVEAIVFTGYSEFCRSLKDCIAQIDLKEFIPTHQDYTPAQLSGYAIEIGLALDKIASDKQTLQLGGGFFTPKGQRLKSRKHAMRFAGGLALFSVVMFSSIYTFFSMKEAQLEKRYNLAVSKIATYTGAKTEYFQSVKGLLRRNRSRLTTAIKNKQEKDRAHADPVSFLSISKWLNTFLLESFSFDQIEYIAQPGGAQVTFIFKGENKEGRAQLLKEGVRLNGAALLVDDELLIHTIEDTVLVKMRVKI
ncbi:MAG: hypothetical protein SP4CHLAM5_04420 [Chlamydiia bacterium]|nr:hypothetical protein [Chlamydiia bacterium]MCH9618315.1 hypothetical protein [Chlamydiia bacterium]MCH9624188.1 hypothetical protein [Chlamydiia bacterium]